MARLGRTLTSTPHRIAIVEDDIDLRDSLARLFTREGHEVRTAATIEEAAELTRGWRPHLMLLDYFLERGTGADVVRAIRAFEPLTQVLLVTGYATDKPARAMLAELDIQGYHDKTEGPARLLVLADAALKHYRAIASLDRQRSRLRHILEVSTEINRLQPPKELLQAALRNMVGLLSAGHGVIATSNNGLFVLDDGATEKVAIHAASGHFAGVQSLRELPPALATAICEGLRADLPYAHPAGCVIIPLQTRAHDRGCMMIDTEMLPEDAIEACQIFAGQIVQALENVLLYERATVDSLTNVYNRGHGDQRFEEILRLAWRTGDRTGVLLADLDRFKQLNDTHGHAAGDVMLRRVGACLAATCRSTDLLARYGGEEFMVILPATDLEGAEIAAEKLRRAVEELEVEFEQTSLRVTLSLGVAVAEPGDLDAAAALARADLALYRAKREGRNCVRAERISADVDSVHCVTA